MGRLDPLAILRSLLVVTLLAWAPAVMAETATTTTTAATAESAAAEPTPGQLEVEAAEHGKGLPQLDVHTFPSQIFWLVVAFVTLFYLMNRKALPRLTEIIETREKIIADDLDTAARLRHDAEAAARQHDEMVASAQIKAQSAIKELQDRLNAETAKRQAELDKELADQLGAAEKRIDASRQQAVSQLRDVATEVAQAAAKRLAGIEASVADAKAALAKALGEQPA